MLDCPWCHQSAMSHLRKSFLGSAIAIPCRHCGKPVSVSMVSLLGLALMLPGVLFALWLLQHALVVAAILAVVASLVAIFAFQALLVPLVKRGD